MKNKKSNEVLPWHFKNQIIMKNVILTAIVFLALGVTTLVYVFKRGLNDEIVKAFTTGNVSTLSQYFAADISMVLLEEEFDDPEEIKSQLQNFFDEYAPKRFNVRHEGGQEHRKISYLIGVLYCKEKTFRITMTFENDQIDNLIIEPEIPFG